jgi:hypothetical protein
LGGEIFSQTRAKEDNLLSDESDEAYWPTSSTREAEIGLPEFCFHEPNDGADRAFRLLGVTKSRRWAFLAT